MSLMGNPVVFRENTPAGEIKSPAIVAFEYRPGRGLVDLVVLKRREDASVEVRYVEQVHFDDPDAPTGHDRGWAFPASPEASGLV